MGVPWGSLGGSFASPWESFGDPWESVRSSASPWVSIAYSQGVPWSAFGVLWGSPGSPLECLGDEGMRWDAKNVLFCLVKLC